MNSEHAQHDPARPRWESRYAAAVVGADVVAILTTIVVGHQLGLGGYSAELGEFSPGLGEFTGALSICCLVVTRAWHPLTLGQGSEEFSRLLRAFVASALLLALAGLALQHQAVRPWVFGLVPLAGLGRLVLRKALMGRRDRGSCMHSALAVGTIASVTELIHRTRRDHHSGYVVAGACTPGGTGPDGAADVAGVPVVGDLDSVAQAGAQRAVRGRRRRPGSAVDLTTPARAGVGPGGHEHRAGGRSRSDGGGRPPLLRRRDGVEGHGIGATPGSGRLAAPQLPPLPAPAVQRAGRQHVAHRSPAAASGEVASFSRDARRRLLVKPGLTGLWQVSGRDDLSWDELLRLDLRYVENWSLALDAPDPLENGRCVVAAMHAGLTYQGSSSALLPMTHRCYFTRS